MSQIGFGKRKRSESSGEAPRRDQLWDALRRLDGVWVRTLLLRISDTQERVAHEIWNEYLERYGKKRVSITAKHQLPEGKGEYGQRDIGFQAYGGNMPIISPGLNTPDLQKIFIPEVDVNPGPEQGQDDSSGASYMDSVIGSPEYINQDLKIPTDRSIDVIDDRGTNSAEPGRHGQVASPTTSTPMPLGIGFQFGYRDAWLALRDSERNDLKPVPMDRVDEAHQKVVSIVNSLSYAAKNASFARKQNILEALRNIAQLLCNPDSALGCKVQKRFRHDTCLEDTMLSILWSMSVEERQNMSDSKEDTNSQKSTPWLEKLIEVWTGGQEHGLFGDLEVIIMLLKGEIEDLGGFSMDDYIASQREEREPSTNKEPNGPLVAGSRPPHDHNSRALLDHRIEAPSSRTAW